MSYRTPYLDYVYKRRRQRQKLECRRAVAGISSTTSTRIHMLCSNCSSKVLSERAPPRRLYQQLGERSIHLDLLPICKPTNSGCARTEEFRKEAPRKDYDPFAWLLSVHRQFPSFRQSAAEYLLDRRSGTKDFETEFKNLRRTADARLAVYRSKINDRGLFSLVDIGAGEMVIEYTGEMVRLQVLEEREKDYKKKGIECFSYQIDGTFALDGTKKGNAARFINHSSKPNCYCQWLNIDGKDHLIIVSRIDIEPLDEITCDYNFTPEKYHVRRCFCEKKPFEKCKN